MLSTAVIGSIFLFNIAISTETISFNEESAPVTVNVISESDTEMVIKFQLNHFRYNQIIFKKYTSTSVTN